MLWGLSNKTIAFSFASFFIASFLLRVPEAAACDEAAALLNLVSHPFIGIDFLLIQQILKGQNFFAKFGYT